RDSAPHREEAWTKLTQNVRHLFRLAKFNRNSIGDDLWQQPNAKESVTLVLGRHAFHAHDSDWVRIVDRVEWHDHFLRDRPRRKEARIRFSGAEPQTGDEQRQAGRPTYYPFATSRAPALHRLHRFPCVSERQRTSNEKQPPGEGSGVGALPSQ